MREEPLPISWQDALALLRDTQNDHFAFTTSNAIPWSAYPKTCYQENQIGFSIVEQLRRYVLYLSCVFLSTFRFILGQFENQPRFVLFGIRELCPPNRSFRNQFNGSIHSAVWWSPLPSFKGQVSNFRHAAGVTLRNLISALQMEVPIAKFLVVTSCVRSRLQHFFHRHIRKMVNCPFHDSGQKWGYNCVFSSFPPSKFVREITDLIASWHTLR